MASRNIVSLQVPIAFCDEVPQQAEYKPAPRESRDERQYNKTPLDLNEGGPEVHQVSKMAMVRNIAKLNVTVAVLGHESCPSNPAFHYAIMNFLADELQHSFRWKNKANFSTWNICVETTLCNKLISYL